MKAIVLAAGQGSRMRRQDGVRLDPAQAAAADAGLKAMMPVPRRPLIDYILSALADADCRDVCIIVAPNDDRIRAYYTSEMPERVRLTFVVQERPLGTANALLEAEVFAAREPFLVMNGDNYYPPDVLRPLAALRGPGLPAFRRSALLAGGNIDAERVLAYAVLRIGPGGILEDVIEKPGAEIARALGDEFYVSMNCWRFDARMFDACRAILPSARGELELPEAVRHAVRVLGVRFETFEAAGGVLDLSRRSDIPEVERRLAAIEARP